MKIRLAKKIMACDFRKEGWGKDLFRDHRITKAISLTRKK